ncbi:methionine-S-sulfoxide reductase [Saprospira grandis DSM 2844]|uniref:Peptide methionine sulfoxide reductase MsrA n=1 Tax=Saprospira grandis DSM 2844 TaxID=694433 RepID=J1I1F8_9BACT|nr:peptide-methionine (S)-S-oxide reductase MsrA [Saprospira grandis]EJF52103.1 methionine-S-sulfoxide reductase [Saprospira grandis DSM 2844]
MWKPLFSLVVSVLILCQYACGPANSPAVVGASDKTVESMEGLAVATLGAGCFWCVEAIFQDLKGVKKVVSGYAGGQVENPTYKAVCAGTTGHAEVVQITFDPEVLSYTDLLEVFFFTHDPTTLNRQGNDVGTQYRSAIFYHSEEQKAAAEKVKAKMAVEFSDPIVTEVVAFDRFYSAEDYHQDYYNLNANKNPYCSAVISPKVNKFRKSYKDKLKEELKK